MNLMISLPICKALPSVSKDTVYYRGTRGITIVSSNKGIPVIRQVSITL